MDRVKDQIPDSHWQDYELLNHALKRNLGQTQHYKKGSMLYWIGDPVEYIFIIKSGAVKIFTISVEGKAQAYAILGTGSLIGATAHLLGKAHDNMCEIVEETDVLSIPATSFGLALAEDPTFARLVMKKMAEGLELLAEKVQDLGQMDVQSRLKHALMELASEHGVPSKKGLRINLEITHQEISELVAANRTTITSYLGQLKKMGYIWKDGNHLYIIPPKHIEMLDNLELSIVQGLEDEAAHLAEETLESGVEPTMALMALTNGMRRVDRMFVRDELDMSDIILSAFAMKRALPIIEGEIGQDGQRIGRLGKVVIGTVHGDIHDIGRTMVSMLLKTRGFDVVDLGINVSTGDFVAAIEKHHPQILGMSSLMTTTIEEQFKVIKALVLEGLRDKVKVMVGGGAITKKLCEQMGADGYERTARGAAELAWRLVRPDEDNMTLASTSP